MDAKKFWLRVKQLSKARKTTQREMAEYLGLPLRTLQNWIQRGIFPLFPDGYRMAVFFGVSVEYLLTGKEKKVERKISKIRSLLTQAEEKLQRLYE